MNRSLEPVRLAYDDPALAGTAERIWSGELAGVVIPGLLSPETRAVVLDRLERNEPAMRRTRGSQGIQVVSQSINTAGDLGEYLDNAAHYRERFPSLFDGVEDFDERFRGALSTMNDGAPFEVLRTERGDAYSPTTIRMMGPGSEIPVHSGNDLQRSEHARHIQSHVDIETQFSFFLLLRAAPAGGRLELFEQEWEPAPPGSNPFSLHVERRERILGGSRPLPVRIEEGDLIVFDGGRIYHRVTPVEGSSGRVTIGGFMSYSLDHSELYHFS